MKYKCARAKFVLFAWTALTVNSSCLEMDASEQTIEIGMGRASDGPQNSSFVPPEESNGSFVTDSGPKLDGSFTAIEADSFEQQATCTADCGSYQDVTCSSVGQCIAVDRNCMNQQAGYVQCGSTVIHCGGSCNGGSCSADGVCNRRCLHDFDCELVEPDPPPGCLADGACNCNCILEAGFPVGDPDCSPHNDCVDCQTVTSCTDSAHCGPGYCTSHNLQSPGSCICP